MNLKPIEDHIIVKVDKPAAKENKTKGGLYLPAQAVEKPQTGTVVAVGPGRVLPNGQRLHVDVRVGDKVLFSKYSGTTVKVDDEKFLILTENDILAVIEGVDSTAQTS